MENWKILINGFIKYRFVCVDNKFMHFHKHCNGDEFLRASRTLIENEKVLNNLIFSIAESNFTVDNNRSIDSPVFITVTLEDSHKTALAAVMTPPKRLVIYTKEDRDCLFDFVAKNIHNNNIHIPGVLGPDNCALLFSKAWEKQTGKFHKISMKERVYKISETNKLPLSSGNFRAAAEDDFPILKEWTSAFMKEALAETASEEDISNIVRRKIKNQSLYVWEDTHLVSMAASARPAKESISVNSVYTPEINRKKGYARSCVAQLTQKLLNDGNKYCTLVTDLMNSTSNKIYKEIGYQEVGDILAIDFK